MRLVVDTNIWVSYLLRSREPFSTIIDDITANHTLLYSAETLLELGEVLTRPKFAKYIKRQDVEAFIAAFAETGEKVEIATVLTVCRDPKDDKFLALAIDGKADYVISGDKDLLDLKSIQNILITTLADFSELTQSS
ncbi:MAG: putative toxin-antitoxin system toxin component, PIN family [Cyanobacteria bacterium P01_F01_bin.33]